MKEYKKYIGIFTAITFSLLIFIFRDSLVYFKQFGYLGLFILNTLGSATLAIPTPLFLTAIAAGSVLNPFFVTIISSLGSAIGELTGYWVGYNAVDVLEKDKNVQKVKGWMDKYGLMALFVLSAIPNPIFDAAGIFAGATKIPVYKYLLIVWLGKMVKFAVLAFSGYFVIN